ncbi:MAG: hypothetical protein GXP25_14200 [Planctomycetes bacterium]|nr:hypothetical protein [Planctomycetota bacterium]
MDADEVEEEDGEKEDEDEEYVVDDEAREIWQRAIDYFFEKTLEYASTSSEPILDIEENEYEDGDGVIWRMCFLKYRNREFRIGFLPPFEAARVELRLSVVPERFAEAPLELLNICHDFGIGLTWNQNESAELGQTMLYLVLSIFWSGYNRETFENSLRLLNMCAEEIEEKFV